MTVVLHEPKREVRSELAQCHYLKIQVCFFPQEPILRKNYLVGSTGAAPNVPPTSAQYRTGQLLPPKQSSGLVVPSSDVG